MIVHQAEGKFGIHLLIYCHTILQYFSLEFQILAPETIVPDETDANDHTTIVQQAEGKFSINLLIYFHNIL